MQNTELCECFVQSKDSYFVMYDSLVLLLIIMLQLSRVYCNAAASVSGSQTFVSVAIVLFSTLDSVMD